MLIKIDHISYSCRTKDIETVREKTFHDYRIKFRESLDNISAKRRYLASWHNRHELIMLFKEGEFPVELTAYESCTELPPSIDAGGAIW